MTFEIDDALELRDAYKRVADALRNQPEVSPLKNEIARDLARLAIVVEQKHGLNTQLQNGQAQDPESGLIIDLLSTISDEEFRKFDHLI